MPAGTDRNTTVAPVVQVDVVTIVALAMKKFTTRLTSVFTDIGSDITDRMDAIAETLGMACNLDQSTDVTGLSMPQHEADALDAIRARNPTTYKQLLTNAEQVWGTPPTGRRRVVKALADQVAQSVKPS
jgi:hypothetical protein